MAEQPNIDNFLDEELEKLYERLKEFPEMGWWPTDPPLKEDWIAEKKEAFDSLAVETPPVSAWKFIVDLYDQYGVAPASTIIDENQYETIASQFSLKNRWYQNTTTHLSKDRKYYIVPIVYERLINNPGLKPFISTTTGKLNITELLENITLSSYVFLKAAKRWALEKAASDLAKAISLDHQEKAETMGFFPKNSQGIDGTEPIAAEAWYIDPRPPEYQNLFLKAMFPRDWIDSLPNKIEPCPVGGATRTVILHTDTLKKDLAHLREILRHFNYQIQNTPVHIDFDGICFAQKVSKIFELLNNVLTLNEKTNLNISLTGGALQLGFTENMQLKYIAHSEIPDCLCDEKNINAYTLKKGVHKLKTTPPFDSPTVNGLLFYLPEIIRKYAPYLKGNKRMYLFAAQESWLHFIKSYIFPKPEITYDTSETEGEFFVKKITAIGDLTKSIGSVTKNILYTRDPTVLMAPDIRQRILGAVSQEMIYGGDKVMLDALTSEILSMTALYDNLLNKVPITELIKLALSALVKCVSDDDLKKKMCDSILRAMPGSEIKTKVIPCLRASGADDAIAHMESLMLTRRSLVYRQAQARAPEKFTKTVADAMKSELDMAAVNELYCSDPEFQDILGRPADDFSEEMLLAREQDKDDAICECILSVYGPVEQIFGFIEEAKDTGGDILDILVSNRAQAIQQSRSDVIDRILRVFRTSDQRTLSGMATSIMTALVESYVAVVLAAMLIVLQHVKSTVLGGLATDICAAPANPFSEKNFSKMVMNSTLYKDNDFNKLRKNFNKLKTLAGLSGDINAIITACDELGRQFTPTEFKRIFTTPCSDNSADDLYKQIHFPGITYDPKKTGDAPFGSSLEYIQEIYYGSATATAEAALALDEGESLDGIVTSFCDMDNEGGRGGLPIDAKHTLLYSFGSQVDDSFYDEIINDHEDLKAELANFCDPESIEIFSKTLGSSDIAAHAQKGKEDILEDIVSILPLLDKDKLMDMMPPLFCGPCNPRKVGQKPLIENQIPGPLLDTFDELNKDTLNTINNMFNNTVDSYKPILLGQTDAHSDMIDAIVQAADDAMQVKEKDKDGKLVYDEDGKTIPTGVYYKGPAAFGASGNAQQELMESLATYAQDNVKDADKIISKNLLTALETATTTDFVAYEYGAFKVFVYTVPPVEGKSPAKTIYLLFNKTDSSKSYQNRMVGPGQIKIVVQETGSDVPLYEWPPPNNNIDFMIGGGSSTGTEITQGLEKMGLGLDFADVSTYDGYFINIIQLLLETIFLEGTKHDMFNGVVFNKIPLTDLEALQSCNSDVGRTPLLNIEQILSDLRDTQKALECVVSRFDTPSAFEITAVYGVCKALFKSCIVEEYLKNIFIFGFLRIEDIMQSSAYMKLLLDNVVNSLQSAVGADSYEDVLDYSSKIINGRMQLGETFPNPPGSSAEESPASGPLGEMQVLRSSEDCLKILILESATEISDILDNRIQSVVDPSWQKKFNKFGDADGAAAEIKDTLSERLLNYVASSSPEYWSPNIFPFDYGNEVSPFGNLCPMRIARAWENNSKASIPWPLQFGVGGTSAGEKDSSERFTNMEDFFNNTGWPNRGAENDEPWSGGFFFQPYVKIIPRVFAYAGQQYHTLGDVVMSDLADNLQVFWETFKESYKYYAPDVINENKPQISGNAPKNELIDLIIKQVEYEATPDGLFETVEGTDGKPTSWVIGGTLEKFFKLFFSPYDNVSESIDSQKYSRSLFMRLVSSFVPSKVDNTFTDWKEGYYYWEDHPSGAGNAQKWNWINRGTTSVNLASGEPLGMKNSQLMEGRDGSTISMFGFAKELKAPDAPNFYDKLIAFATEMGSGEFGGEDEVIADGDGGTTIVPYAYETEKNFWYEIRDIIFDSPSHYWFDFKIGMRLNLIVKINNLDSEVNTIDSVTSAMDNFNLKKYNEEKVFIWQKTADEAYYCFPLESEEQEARDMFSGLVNNWHWTSKLAPAKVISHPSQAPCLWAISRAINQRLDHDNQSQTLENLKLKLLKKLKTSELLTKAFSFKDLAVLVAIIYRHYMQSAYPSIDRLFIPLKNTINRYIAATTAAINGDYQYADPLAEETNPLAELQAAVPDFNELKKKFTIMCIQMAANIVDPTWVTQWFLPGPITPIGIIAKTLSTKWTEDKEGPEDITTELCPPPDWDTVSKESEEYKTELQAKEAEEFFSSDDAVEGTTLEAWITMLEHTQDPLVNEERWNSVLTKWTFNIRYALGQAPLLGPSLSESMISHDMNGLTLKIDFKHELSPLSEIHTYEAALDTSLNSYESSITRIGVKDIVDNCIDGATGCQAQIGSDILLGQAIVQSIQAFINSIEWPPILAPLVTTTWGLSEIAQAVGGAGNVHDVYGTAVYMQGLIIKPPYGTLITTTEGRQRLTYGYHNHVWTPQDIVATPPPDESGYLKWECVPWDHNITSCDDLWFINFTNMKYLKNKPVGVP